ncbi:MAG: AIR synthase related protein, partial [Holophagae bacterium]
MATYKDAGVDIDAQDRALAQVKKMVRNTYTGGVLSDQGAFGGLFRLPKGCKDPVLVASADGVGTKLKVAFATGRHGTVGQDLVNHCINDILVQGAAPLFFLDYLATGRLD